MAGGGKKAGALSPAVQKLAALPILVVLATRRSDGSVQLNPVWFELRDGFIWLNSNTRRTWPKNLQRDRDATMLLVDPKAVIPADHPMNVEHRWLHQPADTEDTAELAFGETVLKAVHGKRRLRR